MSSVNTVWHLGVASLFKIKHLELQHEQWQGWCLAQMTGDRIGNKFSPHPLRMLIAYYFLHYPVL